MTTRRPVRTVMAATLAALTMVFAGGVHTATANPASCAPTTDQQALDVAIAKAEPPFADRPLDDPDNHWSKQIPTDTYNPCANASWIVLNIDRGTASSPYQVAFFHKGTYVGRATNGAFGFAPEVTRISDNLIRVRFRETIGDEGTSEAQLRPTSFYYWNETTNRLEHFGMLPHTMTTPVHPLVS